MYFDLVPFAAPMVAFLPLEFPQLFPQPMRLGIFLPNWIGDVVMATPALRALRKFAGADGHIVGIMRPYVAEVLDGTTWLDEHVLYEKPSQGLGVATPDVYRQLRDARLDRVVLLTNSLRTAWMAWRSGARERIGQSGDARSLLLTKTIAWARNADGTLLPTIDAYLRLAEFAGCEPESPRLELGTTETDEHTADAIWRELNLPPGREVVVLNSGGAYGAAKHWPATHFAELARRIVTDWNLSVLVNCGPWEREIACEIAARANHPRIVSLSNVNHLPLGLTKACIRRSRMIVTTDSGPRFLGIAFGKPVVTLFGPTDSRTTRTHYELETALSLGLDCQPCMARNCPLIHHRCMRELSVDRVYAAVERYLDVAVVEDAA